jgi:hypothetical protein
VWKWNWKIDFFIWMSSNLKSFFFKCFYFIFYFFNFNL